MKKEQFSRQIDQRNRSSFKVMARIFSLLLLLTVSLGTMTACQPNPPSFQIRGVVNCAKVELAAGSLDLSFKQNYLMRLKVVNLLAGTANAATFQPESNDLLLEKAQVWFEYPKDVELNLSNLGGEPNIHTKKYPYSLFLSSILKPGPNIVSSTTGGGGGGGSVSGEAGIIDINLIPRETLALWDRAPQMKTSNGSFKVVAHVKLHAKNWLGSQFETQEFIWQLTICTGCMKREDKEKSTAGCLATGNRASSRLKDKICLGQNWTCLVAEEKGK